MVTLCKIDGQSYDILVTAVAENYNVVEGANKGVALHNQRELRDIQGIKIGHSVTFAPNDEDPEKFDELTRYLFGSIRESVFVEVVHDQTTITYEAAYSVGKRAVTHIDNEKGVVYWGELTVDFRPMENQINAE